MSLGLRVARSRMGGRVAALAVRRPARRLLWLLRLRVLAESPSFIAVRHPRPQYATHLLIVSTAGVRDFLGLDAQGLAEVLALAGELATGGDVELVTNLGSHQDVRLLHFHFIRREAPPSGGRHHADLQPVRDAAAAALGDTGACRVIFGRRAGRWLVEVAGRSIPSSDARRRKVSRRQF